MALFTAKVDYALRALLDLAVQPSGRPVQSREIAARQDVPESYLNQLLVVLRRAGLVRSVRGAAGGYVLGRPPHLVTVADVVAALHGQDILGEAPGGGSAAPAAWVLRNLYTRLNETVRRELQATSLADLTAEVNRLDEAQSLMLGL
jgi:Rrf2 family protein